MGLFYCCLGLGSHSVVQGLLLGLLGTMSFPQLDPGVLAGKAALKLQGTPRLSLYHSCQHVCEPQFPLPHSVRLVLGVGEGGADGLHGESSLPWKSLLLFKVLGSEETPVLWFMGEPWHPPPNSLLWST